MNKPAYHILICSSSRLKGEPVGACNKRGAIDLARYLEEEILDRGIPEVLVTNTGCLKVCDQGPIMVVYPGGHWYGNVDTEVIDDVLDALEEGLPAEERLLC